MSFDSPLEKLYELQHLLKELTLKAGEESGNQLFLQSYLDERWVFLADAYLSKKEYAAAEQILLADQGTDKGFLSLQGGVERILKSIINAYLNQGEIDRAIVLISKVQDDDLWVYEEGAFVRSKAVKSVINHCILHHLPESLIIRASLLIKNAFDRGEMLFEAVRTALENNNEALALSLAHAIPDATYRGNVGFGHLLLDVPISYTRNQAYRMIEGYFKDQGKQFAIPTNALTVRTPNDAQRCIKNPYSKRQPLCSIAELAEGKIIYEPELTRYVNRIIHTTPLRELLNRALAEGPVTLLFDGYVPKWTDRDWVDKHRVIQVRNTDTESDRLLGGILFGIARLCLNEEYLELFKESDLGKVSKQSYVGRIESLLKDRLSLFTPIVQKCVAEYGLFKDTYFDYEYHAMGAGKDWDYLYRGRYCAKHWGEPDCSVQEVADTDVYHPDTGSLIRNFISIVLPEGKVTYHSKFKNDFNQILNTDSSRKLLNKALADGPIFIVPEDLEGQLASWHPGRRWVSVDSKKAKTSFASDILFELANACQSKLISQIIDEAEVGRLSKESYVRRLEELEFETYRDLFFPVLQECLKDPTWQNMVNENEWKFAPSWLAKGFDWEKAKATPHADAYRKDWDHGYKAIYCRINTGKINC